MAVAREGETQSSQFAPTLPSTIEPSSEGSNTKGFSQTLQSFGETEKVQLSQFSQTLQTPVASERRCDWVLNVPEPPGLLSNLKSSFKKTVLCPLENKIQCLGKHPVPAVVSILNVIFPPLSWCKEYNVKNLKRDILAGLTLASLCIPQSIGYATLAKLDPQYGLYTSVTPPLIYAMMGSSREIAIGPVAVVSLLLSSMVPKLEDPTANPIAYRKLVLTVTFFAGIFQAAFGLLRLGFLVDFLSHAAIVGFMAGAACVIGLQQLKSLLGIANFTNKTDIISVLTSICQSMHTARKYKKLFWLAATAPLLSVILSTLVVFLTRADKHGVKIVKHITGGLNPSSVHELQFNSPHTAEAAKIGLIVALVALTEAIAVGRSFATMKGYRLDGNKEMLAMGVMNITGSLTSSYVATGTSNLKSWADLVEEEEVEKKSSVWDNFYISKTLNVGFKLEYVALKKKEEQNEVVQGCMFHFDNKSFIVKAWSLEIEFTRDEVHIVPIWIRLSGFDFKDQSKKGLSKIGSLVGKPVMVDQSTEKKVSLNYARLLVEVELDFTILELIMFKNENENIVEQKVTYDWRPVLCKHSKKYGHSEEQCRKKKGSRCKG
ncbi:Low affinity sulfate transporter 3 [Capsicum annuum]|nr:Low affinity sulfate transporter 3 [Capsicum annuum]